MPIVGMHRSSSGGNRPGTMHGRTRISSNSTRPLWNLANPIPRYAPYGARQPSLLTTMNSKQSLTGPIAIGDLLSLYHASHLSPSRNSGRWGINGLHGRG